MRKLIIGAALVAVGVIVVRRCAPALERGAMRTCEGMFDRMPDDCPPKRMLCGIDDIRDQNARMLKRLEQQGSTLSVAQ